MSEPKKNLVISIAAASLAVVTLFAVDVQIWTFVRNQVPHDFIPISKVVSKRGLYLFYAILAGLIGYSFFKKSTRLKTICMDYIKAQLIFSFAVVRCMKIIFGRARPGYGSEFTFFSLDTRYNSFPSGHSADAFVSGFFLFYLLKHSKYSKYRFLPLVYALLMAVLRLIVNAHYPSDIIAGMAIGILGAYFVLYCRPDKPE